MNTTHDVPDPAGATKIYPWDADGFRCFTGQSWVVVRDDCDHDVDVSVDGKQYPDGLVEREIALTSGGFAGADETLTAAQARQLARPPHQRGRRSASGWPNTTASRCNDERHGRRPEPRRT